MSDDDAFEVEWTMDWGEKRDLARHPERFEQRFEPEQALAVLLQNDICFLNSRWHEDGLGEFQKTLVKVVVNCNDVFMWGLADAEELPYDEIENLYRAWKKDPAFGVAVWCCIQCKMMPQPPLEKMIRAKGIWNLDELDLRPNPSC